GRGGNPTPCTVTRQTTGRRSAMPSTVAPRPGLVERRQAGARRARSPTTRRGAAGVSNARKRRGGAPASPEPRLLAGRHRPRRPRLDAAHQVALVPPGDPAQALDAAVGPAAAGEVVRLAREAHHLHLAPEQAER